jgi:hypothetical protein
MQFNELQNIINNMEVNEMISDRINTMNVESDVKLNKKIINENEKFHIFFKNESIDEDNDNIEYIELINCITIPFNKIMNSYFRMSRERYIRYLKEVDFQYYGYKHISDKIEILLKKWIFFTKKQKYKEIKKIDLLIASAIKSKYRYYTD